MVWLSRDLVLYSTLFSAIFRTWGKTVHISYLNNDFTLITTLRKLNETILEGFLLLFSNEETPFKTEHVTQWRLSDEHMRCTGMKTNAESNKICVALLLHKRQETQGIVLSVKEWEVHTMWKRQIVEITTNSLSSSSI